jgi:hypothetical protein
MIDPGDNRPAHLQLLAVSWNLGWPVAAGVVLGHWIDVTVGSSPAATLGLGLGAFAMAIWRILVLGKEEIDERHREEDERDHR